MPAPSSAAATDGDSARHESFRGFAGLARHHEAWRRRLIRLRADLALSDERTALDELVRGPFAAALQRETLRQSVDEFLSKDPRLEGMPATSVRVGVPTGLVEELTGKLMGGFADQVTLRLEDEIDVSRGDMIARLRNQPHIGQDIEAMVCWMSESTWLREGAKLALKHTTRWVRALVKDLQYQLDVNTLHRYEDAVGLSLNEIGRVTLRTTQPLFYDEYRRNRSTGSFILVDAATNTTVGAGMILAPLSE